MAMARNLHNIVDTIRKIAALVGFPSNAIQYPAQENPMIDREQLRADLDQLEARLIAIRDSL
jgi:hypothetical protein